MPLPARLRTLQTELAALEGELEDPSNPRLHDVDAGSLIRGLIDVKGRLEKIRDGREGRGRLVSLIMTDENDHAIREEATQDKAGLNGDSPSQDTKGSSAGKKSDMPHEDGSNPETRSIIEMDKRVGELEKLVGSSGTFLDEVRIILHLKDISWTNDLNSGFSFATTVATPYHASAEPTYASHATSTYRLCFSTFETSLVGIGPNVIDFLST
jgi:hypothetical protein